VQLFTNDEYREIDIERRPIENLDFITFHLNIQNHCLDYAFPNSRRRPVELVDLESLHRLPVPAQGGQIDDYFLANRYLFSKLFL
jgi:hypothetical protein